MERFTQTGNTGHGIAQKRVGWSSITSIECDGVKNSLYAPAHNLDRGPTS